MAWGKLEHQQGRNTSWVTEGGCWTPAGGRGARFAETVHLATIPHRGARIAGTAGCLCAATMRAAKPATCIPMIMAKISHTRLHRLWSLSPFSSMALLAPTDLITQLRVAALTPKPARGGRSALLLDCAAVLLTAGDSFAARSFRGQAGHNFDAVWLTAGGDFFARSLCGRAGHECS